MIDSYPLEWEDSIKKVLAIGWQWLIPGHPGAPTADSEPKKTRKTS